MTEKQIKQADKAIHEIAEIMDMIGIDELHISDHNTVVIWNAGYLDVKALERFAQQISITHSEIKAI